MKIAYIVSRYPAISHTFVLREVAALRRLGVEVDTFSVRRVGRDQLLSAADRAEFDRTSAILPIKPLALVASHARAVARSPLGYMRTLAGALRSVKGARDRCWQAFYFAEAIILWERCRARGIRHIHAHFANVAADVALLASAFGSTCGDGWSYSFTMHGPTEFYDVKHHRLGRKVAGAAFVACISDFCRSQLMTFSDPSVWPRLHVVHCGVETQRFRPDRESGDQIRAKESAAAEKASPVFHILSVGRLVPEKGHAILLAAAARLVQAGIKLRVTIIGNGPEKDRLRRQAEALSITEQVVFAGAVGQDDIRGYYAAADVFCLPSFAEGVPVVLMEAMAMELPVVSTRIMGIPELIAHERSGLLVSPGRADQLADALASLAADADLRRKMGVAGRATILSDFNVEHSAARLHALFEGLPAAQTRVAGPVQAPLDDGSPLAAGSSVNGVL